MAIKRNIILNSGDAAQVFVEVSQTHAGNIALTDSGDHTYFTTQGDGSFERISEYLNRNTGDSYKHVSRPNGVIEGCRVIPHADDNKVIVQAGYINVDGVKVQINQTTVTLVRPAGSNVRTTLIVATDAGVTAGGIAGADNATFSTTRDTAGGPEYAAAGDVELAWVKLSGSTDAPVEAADILALPNENRESTSFPTIYFDHYTGAATFSQALMLNHTGGTTKAIYVDYYTPIFQQLELSAAIQTPAITHSASEYKYNGGLVGSNVTEGVSPGSFSIYAGDEMFQLINNTEAWVKVIYVPTEDVVDYGVAALAGAVEPQGPDPTKYDAKFTLTPLGGAFKRGVDY